MNIKTCLQFTNRKKSSCFSIFVGVRVCASVVLLSLLPITLKAAIYPLKLIVVDPIRKEMCVSIASSGINYDSGFS